MLGCNQYCYNVLECTLLTVAVPYYKTDNNVFVYFFSGMVPLSNFGIASQSITAVKITGVNYNQWQLNPNSVKTSVTRG
jgi:hypothetical protein